MQYLRNFKTQPKPKLPTLSNLFAEGDNSVKGGADINSRLALLREILILSSTSGNHADFLDNLATVSKNLHLIVIKWQGTTQFSSILFSIPWRKLVFRDADGIKMVSILLDILSDMIALSPSYIHTMVSNIVLKIFLGDVDDTTGNTLSPSESQVFHKTHKFMEDLVLTYPSASRLITGLLSNNFPHNITSTPHSYIAYLTNVLTCLDYLPDTYSILRLLIDKLVWLELSSHCLRNELSSNDKINAANSSNDVDKAALELALKSFNLFDSGFDLLLTKIHSILHPDSITYECTKAETTIGALEDIFFNQVINIESLVNLPFALIYWSNFSEDLCESTLERLWSTCVNSSVQSINKSRTVLILASMMVEASYISLDQVLIFLENAVNWSLRYADSHSDISIDSNFDPNHHALFYSITQSIFYLISCKISDFSPIQLKSLRLLNLQSLIGTKLNPLLYCLPTIVEQFVEIARDYQIALCSIVVDRNKRLNIDVSPFFNHPLCYYFPFNSFTFQLAASKFDSILCY